jgi:hypothetical protein
MPGTAASWVRLAAQSAVGDGPSREVDDAQRLSEWVEDLDSGEAQAEG